MSEDVQPRVAVERRGQSLEETKGYARRRRRSQRHRRKRWLRKARSRLMPFLILGITLGVVIVVLSAVLISNAMIDVERSRDRLSRRFDMLQNSPATELTLKDYEQLSELVRQFNADLNKLNSRTRFVQVPAQQISSDYEIQFELLDAAIHATSGTRLFLDGLKPTIVLLQREGVLETEDQASQDITRVARGIRTVELLDAGRGQFLRASNQIALAQQILNNLNLPDISPERLLDVQTLREFVDQIETYNNLALESPDLLTTALGIGQSKVYLVVAQNNDELRPSGGFIGTWGWMQVRNGRIQEYDYFPATRDNPTPPDPALAEELDIPDWWIPFSQPIYAAWDGSWYADFPSTGEMAAWYYNNGENPFVPVDGVIGLDLIALEYIIEALGDVSVREYDAIVNAGNFRKAIYDVRANPERPRDHKLFVAALYKEVIDDWQRADSETQSAINRALLQALREKHLMLYFAEDDIQNAATTLKWTGDQAGIDHHDYLMVADANIEANKSSSSVLRQITYDVTIEDEGTLSSRLSVFYDFPEIVAEQDPAVAPEHYGRNKDYGSLTQVFVPLGSQLRSGNMNSAIVVEDRDPYSIITGYVSVPFNESQRVQLEYANPQTVENLGPFKRYRLLVEKQPGTRNDAASVTVNLPPGAQVVDVTPEPIAQYNLGQPVLEFDLTLRQNAWVEIIFE